MRIRDLQEIIDDLPVETLVHVPYGDEPGEDDYVTGAYLGRCGELLLSATRADYERDNAQATLWDIDEQGPTYELESLKAQAGRQLTELEHGVNRRCWRQTHEARAVYTCPFCGLSAVVNVRPAPGAPQQEKLFGKALTTRCRG